VRITSRELMTAATSEKNNPRFECFFILKKTHLFLFYLPLLLGWQKCRFSQREHRMQCGRPPRPLPVVLTRLPKLAASHPASKEPLVNRTEHRLHVI